MSDKMYPMPFEQLLHWVLSEMKTQGTIFGVIPAPAQTGGPEVTYQGKTLAVPFGPAAGPHTQLAQNILCAYAAGARYFELKTVQIIDGDSLHVDKPCIFARQEGYNVEWSSELTVQAAFEEYAKAWFLLHIVSRELYDSDDGFIFNMSVGYDLEGIKSPKIDGFLNMMRDASDTPIWKHMKDTAHHRIHMFTRLTQQDINAIPVMISDSVTLSTLHGCPSSEIEAIAAHLMCEKKLHTSVKCNPMLLGLAFVKQTLSNAGYSYLEPDEKVFEADLTFSEAVAMIRRLKEAADSCGADFGIKLTNTLPVKSYGGLLPGDSYYVSGSALYPLTMTVTARLGAALGGQIHMSYSGGAEESNVADILRAGIWPVTVSTRLLKPGGYHNITKMAAKLAAIKPGDIDQAQLSQLAEKALKKPGKQPIKLDHPVKKAVSAGDRLCHFCNNCIDVCPNRANVGFTVNGQKIALHIDAFCNECGNCADFCPKGFVPYKDKLTLFDTPAHLKDSANEGFAIEEHSYTKCLVRFNNETSEKADGSITGEKQIDALLDAVLSGCDYLIEPGMNAAERTDM